MTNQLQEILEKLVNAHKDADMDLDSIEPRVRPGWAMRKAAGSQSVVDLTEVYRTELGKSITEKFFLNGSPEAVKTFVTFLGDYGVDGLYVDASAMYRRIAESIADSMGLRGEFSLNQFSLMNSMVGTIAVENPEIDIKDGTCEFASDIKSMEVLIKHIKYCFRATNGNKVNVALLNKRLVKQAMNSELVDNTVLFIRGADKEELADISLGVLGGPARTVDVPEEPSPEWVLLTGTELGLIKPLATEGEAPVKKTRKYTKKNTTTTNNQE